MIIAEMVLTLSWTMLFEIVCENMNNPLKDHSNLELLLRRRMADIGPLAPKRPHNARTTPRTTPLGRRVGESGVLRQPFFRTPWRIGSTAGRGSTTGRAGAEEAITPSWTMLFEIVCKSTHDPLQDHRNL